MRSSTMSRLPRSSSANQRRTTALLSSLVNIRSLPPGKVRRHCGRVKAALARYRRANLHHVAAQTGEEAEDLLTFARGHLEVVKRRARVAHEHGPVLVVDAHALVRPSHIAAAVERGPTGRFDHVVHDQ